MITLEKVSIWRGEHEIFSDPNLAFHPGQRVGIFGRNGAGKSTLFALLTGKIGADQGLTPDLEWGLVRTYPGTCQLFVI